jgi:hypothetical protein
MFPFISLAAAALFFKNTSINLFHQTKSFLFSSVEEQTLGSLCTFRITTPII